MSPKGVLKIQQQKITRIKFTLGIFRCKCTELELSPIFLCYKGNYQYTELILSLNRVRMAFIILTNEHSIYTLLRNIMRLVCMEWNFFLPSVYVSTISLCIRDVYNYTSIYAPVCMDKLRNDNQICVNFYWKFAIYIVFLCIYDFKPWQKQIIYA